MDNQPTMSNKESEVTQIYHKMVGNLHKQFQKYSMTQKY